MCTSPFWAVLTNQTKWCAVTFLKYVAAIFSGKSFQKRHKGYVFPHLQMCSGFAEGAL